MQIGDENVHLLRSILDEVFGSENFISQIAVRKTTGETSDSSAQHVIIYYGMEKTEQTLNGEVFLLIRQKRQTNDIVRLYLLKKIEDIG